MKRIIALALLIGLLFRLDAANAQIYEPFSQWRVDASLPLQFNTNSLLTPTNSQSDFFTSPYLKLSALGTLDSTTSYSVYVNGGPDAFARVQTANDALAVAGGKFQKTFRNFAVGAIYERALVYDGVFRSLLYQANDFSGYVGYGYDNGAGLTIKPSFLTTYRSADVSSAERFSYTLKADIQQNLTKNVLVFFTPKLKYLAYTAGISSGKRNTDPSILGGLTYNISDDLSLTASVEYDRQWSNVAGNNFANTIFLLSADFGHTYELRALK
jgi:hypothetical protein